ncbi:MAG: DUF4214 domain-containing protein [Burkholderiaceae bacterium]|nr:MAG: DUF4214 domain-containing protein [Burkholderiaceae bacterium]
MKNSSQLKKISFHPSTILVAACLTACGGNVDVPSGSSNLAMAPAPTSTTSKIETFKGIRNQYQISQTVNGFVVRDLVGNEPAREISGVDSLKFADLTVNLKIGDIAKTIPEDALKNIIELYVAFFNRVPDADGLAYWIKQYQGGATIKQIADNFYQAALLYSSSTGYTTDLSNADFVKLIYKNVLGRTGATEPPAQDVQYWVDQLTKGTATKSSLVITMLNSAHTFEGDAQFGWVPGLLNNKISTAKFFSIEQGISYLSADDSIKKGARIAAAVTPQSTNAAKVEIGLNDFNFNLARSNTLLENLNNLGVLLDDKGDSHPLRMTLQLDANGMATSGNYDFRHLSGTMTACTNSSASCIGTQASFTKIKLSAPLTLAGATDDTKYLVVEDDAGNVFTGSISGVVWSGTWTRHVSPKTPSDTGKFSVVLRLLSSKNTVSSYNVQDLMLQFYSQRATWSLKGESYGVTSSIEGSFESIPSSNDGGSFSVDGQLLKQMDTVLKTSGTTESIANAKGVIRHINYSPVTAQIGLVSLEPSGMEFFFKSKDPSTFFPTNAKMGDSGTNGSSENRGGYPQNMAVTSNTTYAWNLAQENGRDLLCISTEETSIPSGVRDKLVRCHNINPDGKLGAYLSISRKFYLASGTFTSGYTLVSQ